MAGYTLYTGGPYKQRTGSAITASSTDVNGGSAKNVSSNENFRRSDWQEGNSDVPRLIPGTNGAAGAEMIFLDSFDTANITSSNGLVSMVFDGNHELSVNDCILIPDAAFGFNIYRIITVVSADTIVINMKYSSLLTGLGSLSAMKIVGTFGEQEVENFIMKKSNANVHGQANTDLQSGAADYGRNKVHRITALRTSKVTTAIRAGRWNIFTGEFSVAPSTSNDYASMDLDGTNVPDEEAKDSTTKYGTKGELAYNHGGRTVKQQDYEAKTG